ncbi:MAG: squalene/phytoene synthase family protein [Deltaproteobacteria bacterium]|nr:squalene/phytoene synthase family protein [Deltaproteobacteria bacterium]
MKKDNHHDDFTFCEESLVRVSRTFSINIKILTGTAYKAVLLAYLLCRIADTIEDDPWFSRTYKLQKLCEYADLFPPSSNYREQTEVFLRDIAFRQTNDSTALLMDLTRVMNEFAKLPRGIISLISDHVREMSYGMATFQRKDSGKEIQFIEDTGELSRYCYFVAGTVGLMLTSIFAETSSLITPRIRHELEERSVAFGLGLQITNIAKDFYGDRERGWCYVPRVFFTDEGIDPLRHTFDDNRTGFVNAHRRLIDLALIYLDEALEYTLLMPRRLIRFRLFCLWPLFMAIESLAVIMGKQNLFRGEVVKISRNDVKRIVRDTTLAVMSNGALRLMYNRTRRKITGQE